MKRLREADGRDVDLLHGVTRIMYSRTHCTFSILESRIANFTIKNCIYRNYNFILYLKNNSIEHIQKFKIFLIFN